MNRPIETLLFDFGGTLDADGVAWKDRFYALYRAEGLEMTTDVFQSSFFAADDALVGCLEPTADLPGTVHALVANLEAELTRRNGGAHNGDIGNGGGNADRGLRVATRFLSDASAAFARNRPVLERLAARYRLGIVSNFYGNLEAVCRGAGLTSLFGAVVDSHCVGVEKPDPAIFHAALQSLRAKPETTVLVGDSLHRDREGARRTGLRFFWMASEHARRAVPAGLTDGAGEYALAELRDVMKILT